MESKPSSDLKRVLKAIGNAIALVAGYLPALSCWIESRVSDREDVFRFWGQSFSLIPGSLGSYLRKGFYRWTLRSCSRDCQIEFLACFSNRSATVGSGVYIGAGTTIGTATLADGCLIGSRVSILSGSSQHSFGSDGRLVDGVLTRVHVGAHTWIGEGAILMADVGSRCIVAAGTVVAGHSIPDGSVVGGNPSRFIRRTNVSADADVVGHKESGAGSKQDRASSPPAAGANDSVSAENVEFIREEIS